MPAGNPATFEYKRVDYLTGGKVLAFIQMGTATDITELAIPKGLYHRL